ncbi:MAG: hypothetical protein LH473_00870, partial [Chitinophagales bacterium]|nr:hypothetical protein [Chitinophagales bacterium]
MKHQLQITIVFLFLLFQNAQAQSLMYADQLGGNDTQSATSIAADHNENTFVSIVFYNEVDVDPGAAVVKLTSKGSGDIAVTKLSSAGSFIWAFQLGGSDFEGANKITTDMDGNVLISGYFKSTIDFDPGAAIHNLTPTGEQDGFLAKYDNNGNYLWAYKIGSTGFEEFYGLDVDSSGNVYTTGYFQNTIDFDPGAGITNLTAIGGNALFIWKLDKNGIFVFAKQIAIVTAHDLKLDESKNIYITGEFFGTVDFNPGNGTFNLTASGFNTDAFVLKLNGDGIFQWSISMSGTSYESGKSIDIDHAGHVLIGGYFQGTVDFDPGNGIYNLASTGYYDSFIECFNNDGSFVWVKTYGGVAWDDVTAIAVDATSNIHLTGAFEQTTDFDPSGSSFQLTSKGYTDGYHLVLDSAGNFISAFQLGGILDDCISKMVLDDEGGILTCGYFSWIVDFDPGIEENNLTTYSGWDGFAAKYCTSISVENFVTICEGESYFTAGAWQTEPGDYYDYYDPTIGCDSIVITHLSLSEPLVLLGTDAGVCEGDSLLLDAGNTGAQFIWNTGATTQTIYVTTGATYSIEVTDNNGCKNSDTITVTLNPLPLISFAYDGDTIICLSDFVLILTEGFPSGGTYSGAGVAGNT